LSGPRLSAGPRLKVPEANLSCRSTASGPQMACCGGPLSRFGAMNAARGATASSLFARARFGPARQLSVLGPPGRPAGGRYTTPTVPRGPRSSRPRPHCYRLHHLRRGTRDGVARNSVHLHTHVFLVSRCLLLLPLLLIAVGGPSLACVGALLRPSVRAGLWAAVAVLSTAGGLERDSSWLWPSLVAVVPSTSWRPTWLFFVDGVTAASSDGCRTSFLSSCICLGALGCLA